MPMPELYSAAAEELSGFGFGFGFGLGLGLEPRLHWSELGPSYWSESIRCHEFAVQSRPSRTISSTSILPSVELELELELELKEAEDPIRLERKR